MPQCPFYGFRWPERSLQLCHVGGNECGLEWVRQAPCLMEMEGQAVNYYRCPLVVSMTGQLSAVRGRIGFVAPVENTTLERWELENWATRSGGGRV